MMSPSIARAYSGLLAASSAAVSKQLPLRSLPPQMSGRAGFHIPSLDELPSLLRPEGTVERPQQKVVRGMSAALLYSVNKRSIRHPERLLVTDAERQILRSLKGPDTTQKPTGYGSQQIARPRNCVYCRLLHDLLYRQPQELDRAAFSSGPPIAVVNHSAHAVPSFDPDTNVAEARIGNGATAPFQLLVPKQVALEMLKMAHPLRWHEGAGELFERSDPALQNSDGSWGSTDLAIEEWNGIVGPKYLYERVTWRWNQDLSAEIENIIRISDLVLPSAKNGYLDVLGYTYGLESCLGSNLGVAWEPKGLDIDDGVYLGEARPWPTIGGEHVNSVTRRDLLHLLQATPNAALNAGFFSKGGLQPSDPLNQGTFDDNRLEPDEAAAFVRAIAQQLSAAYEVEFWLITISASKRLRFTVPRNGPADFWASLTWSAPALLLVFLNRSLCQTAHNLVRKWLEDRKGVQPRPTEATSVAAKINETS